MKDLPIIAKAVINICLYVLYVLITSFVFSIVFPLTLQVLGKEVLHPSDPIFAKIQVFIAVLVLLISLILRRYFYVSFSTERAVITKSKEPSKTQEKEDEDIKIYIEREIK